MIENQRTVLIADDEPEIRSLVRLYLEKDGYNVIEATDGIEVLNLINEKIDLLILDLMMPQINGIEVLKRVRKVNNMPIIILSAKTEGYDRVLGLDLGADDYITKPFDPLELVARVSSNIRRFYHLGSRNSSSNGVLTVRDVVLDKDECVLIVKGKRIELTSVEYKILLLFMSNPGTVFTKQQIYEAGWNDITIVDDNSIMVCISKLRNKLSDTNEIYITTIRGLGYRFEK